MAVTQYYNPASPYSTTDIVKNTYLDVINYKVIPKYASDILYTILPQYEYRPDLLAYDLYKNSKLWWVFAGRNPNTLGADPYFYFTSGTQIYIPRYETLKNVLGL
jgi:hypothetical protein